MTWLRLQSRPSGVNYESKEQNNDGTVISVEFGRWVPNGSSGNNQVTVLLKRRRATDIGYQTAYFFVCTLVVSPQGARGKGAGLVLGKVYGAKKSGWGGAHFAQGNCTGAMPCCG